MISSLVLACRTNTPAHLIEEVSHLDFALIPLWLKEALLQLYGPRTVLIPKMPALGLLLEEPIFDSYNTRMDVINEKLQPSDPDYRPPISFDNYRETINAFKQKFIYDNMREVEDRDGLCVKSLH
jgi:tRNA pseudouridine38-40 synthase